MTHRYRSSEGQKLIVALARSLADNTLGSWLLLSSLMLFTFSERCPPLNNRSTLDPSSPIHNFLLLLLSLVAVRRSPSIAPMNSWKSRSEPPSPSPSP